MKLRQIDEQLTKAWRSACAATTAVGRVVWLERVDELLDLRLVVAPRT